MITWRTSLKTLNLPIRPRAVVENIARSCANPDEFLDELRMVYPDLTTGDDLSWQVAATFALKTQFLLDSVQAGAEWDSYNERHNYY